MIRWAPLHASKQIAASDLSKENRSASLTILCKYQRRVQYIVALNWNPTMLGYAAAYVSIIQARKFMLWQFNQLNPLLGQYGLHSSNRRWCTHQNHFITATPSPALVFRWIFSFVTLKITISHLYAKAMDRRGWTSPLLPLHRNTILQLELSVAMAWIW